MVACAPLALRATDTPAQAAARAQVVEKLKALEAQQAVMTSHSNAVHVMIAPPAHPTVVATPVATKDAEPVLKPVAKAKLNQDPIPVPVKTPAPAVVNPTVPSPVTDVGNDIGLKMAAPPALPLAASKEARLQTLLMKYQADQISPEEYHKQRAEILAEP
jgi:hypothetical protein